MLGIQKGNSSSFGQPIYGTRVFKPTFEGYHYKFSVLLPTAVIRGGKQDQVFTKQDFKKLSIRFDNDFGGFTQHKVVGEWINPQKEIIVNEHMRYEIYSRRHDKAVEYFKDLRDQLELYKGEKIIVIEQSEVTFVSRPAPKIKHLLRKIRKLERENKSLTGKTK
jgi:hypothetical protein